MGEAAVCGVCPLRARCTSAARRVVKRHMYEDALQRMQQRATAEAMRLRRCVVERVFAELKYRIFGHPRFLLRGRGGAQTEISLATLAYNLKRMMTVLGGAKACGQPWPAKRAPASSVQRPSSPENVSGVSRRSNQQAIRSFVTGSLVNEVIIANRLCGRVRSWRSVWSPARCGILVIIACEISRLAAICFRLLRAVS